MKVTGKLLDMIRQEIESIDFGVVHITVNSKGSFIEITTENRKRIVKDIGNDTARVYEQVYHNDGEKRKPIQID